jgi:hypothetical protein
MNRRTFLTYLGLSAIPIAYGGYTFFLKKKISQKTFRNNLETLYDPMFKLAAEKFSRSDLRNKLTLKNVLLENGEINHSAIKKLAKSEVPLK